MILIWLVLTLNAIFRAVHSETVCDLCKCAEKKIDCSSRNLTNHFNDTNLRDLNVDHLDFSGNKIIHLRPFPRMSLVRLSFRHNAIYRIDEATFRSLSNLTELDLSYNHLTSNLLVPDIFTGRYEPGELMPISSLTTLKLSGNSLHTLHNNLFEHLPNIKVLLLDSNPFKMIDHSTAIALSSCYFLEVLDLSTTMLKSFPTSLFHSPKFLKVLNISSNYFTEVPEVLQETHSLQELVLDDNPIERITHFPSVATLKVLKMNYMPRLRSIGSRALSNLTNLQELHCSNNIHLKKIAGNALSRLPEGREDGETWPPISKLLLNDNNLGYLDAEMVSRWDHMEKADLQRNPWVCDCNNEWMLYEAIPRINFTDTRLITGILCHEPEEMRGFSLSELSLQKVHLRCLDLYSHRPERDANILIGVFLVTVLILPFIVFTTILLRRRLQIDEVPFSKLPAYSHISIT